FVTLVAALSARRPLVLVFDDIHLARSPVADLAERLVARKRQTPSPLLVIATGRQELLDERPGWGGSASNHTLVRLERLDDEESRDLARQAGGGRLGEDIALHVAEPAGGNPVL